MVTKTWIDGEVLYAADLNQDFTDVETFIHGTLAPNVTYTKTKADGAWASVSTNMNYDSNVLEYRGLPAASIVLNPAVGGIGGMYPVANQQNLWPQSYSKGFIAFDYVISDLVDECDNSSVDGTIWSTTGSGGTGTETLSEDTDRLRMTSSCVGAQRTSNLIMSTNFYNSGQSCWIYTINRPNTTNPTTHHGWLYITNGTSTVQIYDTGSLGAATTQTSEYHILFSATGDKCWAWVNNIYTGEFSLSGLSGTTRKVQVTISPNFSNSATCLLDIYFARKPKATPTTTPLITLTLDGTNFNTPNANGLITTANSGCVLQPKMTATMAAGEVISVRGFKTFSWS